MDVLGYAAHLLDDGPTRTLSLIAIIEGSDGPAGCVFLNKTVHGDVETALDSAGISPLSCWLPDLDGDSYAAVSISTAAEIDASRARDLYDATLAEDRDFALRYGTWWTTRPV